MKGSFALLHPICCFCGKLWHVISFMINLNLKNSHLFHCFCWKLIPVIEGIRKIFWNFKLTVLIISFYPLSILHFYTLPYTFLPWHLPFFFFFLLFTVVNSRCLREAQELVRPEIILTGCSSLQSRDFISQRWFLVA